MKKMVIGLLIVAAAVCIAAYLYKNYAPKSEEITDTNGPALNSNVPPVPTIKPIIKITEIPEKVAANEPFEVKWEIEASESRPFFHSHIHYGPESKSGELTVSSYPQTGKIFQGTIPEKFSDTVKAPEDGKIYIRAHVIVDGQHYWSDEKTVTVK